MASTSYSFLDIVVLDGVRERFAAGDALAVLSLNLDEILWVNGAGAAWLGFPDIEAAIGERPRLSATALRQIAAAPGFPNIGRDRTIALRMTRGLKSRIVTVQASAVTLPEGEEALLLALPLPEEEKPSHRTVAGLSEPGHFAALVEADGSVSVATEGFDLLGIKPETLLRLVQDVSREETRLVKKRIPARAQVPAGIARLTDDPARHLLVVVEDGSAEEEIATAAPNPAEASRIEAQGAGGVPQSDAGEPRKAPESSGQPSYLREQDEKPASRTVRFSWRTDAQGRFSAISDEFIETVGRNASDVIGRTFRQVSNAFGLDPEGSISRLLDRRDTWSGRTVMWPLEGTNLKVPVDLAALPVYGRGRVFEGFRGFGIARLGEVVVDPEAIGMVLAPSTREDTESDGTAPEEHETEQSTDLPEQGDRAASGSSIETDAFEGETPTAAVAGEANSGDKIVSLAEHRESAASGSLSASERTAFREIGERLRRASEGRAATDEEQNVSKLPVSGREAENDDRLDGTVSAEAEPPTLDDALQGRGAAEADVVEGPANENVSQPLLSGERHDLGVVPDDEQDAEEAAVEEHGASARHIDEGSPEDLADASSDMQPATGESEAPAEDSAETRAEPVHLSEIETPQEEAARSDLGPETPSVEEPEETSQHLGDGSPEKAPRTASEPATGETAPERTSQIAYLPSAFHRPEAERRQTEAETILANLPLPVLIHSGDRLHYANREFLKLTGYPDLAALEDAGGIGALFEEPAAGGFPKEKLLLRKADGTDGPVEAHLQSVAWAGRKALMLALHPAEQKEQTPEEAAKAAELETRLSEMRAIVDTATDGIAVIGNDGTIRSINRPAEALFGFDAENVTGKPFTSLFAIESQRTVQDYLAGLADNGVASVLNDGRQVIGREAQGRFIPLFITIGRLPNGSGYCAVLRDITHWKRAEEELTQARAQAERASSQKSEFLARVSHEIRTPLNAIIGFSELMIDEKFGPIGNERYRDYLRDINRSGNHVLDLVNDLLDISKIEAGQQEMAYEAVSLNDTLAQVIAMMQPQANRERVIIRSSLASRLPEVVADLRSVRQIAINLLSNAVRYTPAGGQVVVSTVYERDGSVVLRVRDTGVGMSSAELDEALKPFRQINALRRKRGDGTGLGLPLTRAMVEANRAQFSIASTPGEGTLVEITFPPTRVLAE